MPRSLKKGPFVDKYIPKKMEVAKKEANPAKRVVSIEYDPNRSARLALLQYADGEKAYILAPQNLKVGDQVIAAN